MAQRGTTNRKLERSARRDRQDVPRRPTEAPRTLQESSQQVPGISYRFHKKEAAHPARVRPSFAPHVPDQGFRNMGEGSCAADMRRPKAAPGRPSSIQDSPMTAPESLQTALEAPKTAPESPKAAPRQDPEGTSHRKVQRPAPKRFEPRGSRLEASCPLVAATGRGSENSERSSAGR